MYSVATLAVLAATDYYSRNMSIVINMFAADVLGLIYSIRAAEFSIVGRKYNPTGHDVQR